MAARLGWSLETSDFFSATVWNEGEARRHLLVESLPEGGWDWSAWSADGSGQVLHGQALTAGLAMAAAERAARLMDGLPVAGRRCGPVYHLNPGYGRPN